MCQHPQPHWLALPHQQPDQHPRAGILLRELHGQSPMTPLSHLCKGAESRRDSLMTSTHPPTGISPDRPGPSIPCTLSCWDKRHPWLLSYTRDASWPIGEHQNCLAANEERPLNGYIASLLINNYTQPRDVQPLVVDSTIAEQLWNWLPLVPSRWLSDYRSSLSRWYCHCG